MDVEEITSTQRADIETDQMTEELIRLRWVVAGMRSLTVNWRTMAADARQVADGAHQGIANAQASMLGICASMAEQTLEVAGDEPMSPALQLAFHAKVVQQLAEQIAPGAPPSSAGS
jgi:hypothetical protein